MFKHYLEHIYMEDKGYLSSQFTIGFELEGWMPKSTDKTADDFWQFSVDYFNERGYKMVSRNIDYDVTVHPDDGSHESFELQSPVFPCTPHALQDIMHFLDQARRYGIETNNSCGFHVHIGFPDKFSVMEDRLWTILQIVFSKNNILDMFTSFNQFTFTSNSWAHTTFLATIKNSFTRMAEKIQQGDDLSNVFAEFYQETYRRNVKESILHLHPQGTLEWRGPRAFLDTGEYKYVKDFFIRLPKLITILSDLLNTQTLTVPTKHGEFTLRKSDYQIIMPKEGRHAPRTVRKKFINKDSRFKWEDQDSKVLEQAFKDLLWLKSANLSGIKIEAIHGQSYKYSVAGSSIRDVRNISDCKLRLINHIENCTIGDQNSETDIDTCEIYNSDIFNAEVDKTTFTNGAIHSGFLKRSTLHRVKIINPTTHDIAADNCSVSGGTHTKSVFTNTTITGGSFHNCEFHHCKRKAGTFDSGCNITDDVLDD